MHACLLMVFGLVGGSFLISLILPAEMQGLPAPLYSLRGVLTFPKSIVQSAREGVDPEEVGRPSVGLLWGKRQSL